MSPIDIGWLGLVIMISLLMSGIPVGICMAVVGFGGFALISGLPAALSLVRTVPYTSAANYGLSVIPLFVLMGQLAFKSGIGEDLYIAGHKWFGHRSGGLAMATIGAAAGFGAICGSSAASTATFASVALPEMRKMKYDAGFGAAAIAAAGTLAILIPPSNGFIIFGIITQQSIGKLFMAGVIPGIILAFFYGISIWWRARRNPEIAPRGDRYPWRERFASLGGCWPMVVLFLFVMGGIYGGVFTPTEAGALGAFGALLFLISRGQCNRVNLVTSLRGTLDVTAMMFLILTGGYIFGYFLAISGVPRAVAGSFQALPVDRYVIIIGILIMYFIMGFFLDMLSMVVVTTPIFFPLVVALGFDPIWYGVMIVVAMEQGQLTPPFGINLFIVQGVARDVPLQNIIGHIWPFIYAIFLFMFLMLAFPDLALFLPRAMK